MGDIQKLKNISDKGIILINKFISDAKEVGGDFLKEVQQCENGDITLINNNDDVLEYGISEIGYIFNDGIKGFWDEREKFLNNVEWDIKNSYVHYQKLSKEEFINYVGKLHYIRNRYRELKVTLKKLGEEIELI